MGWSPFRFGIDRTQWDALSLYGRFEQVISWVLTAGIAMVIVVAVVRLIADVVSMLVLSALSPLEHEMFQAIFGGIMTVLISMEFGHSILQASARVKSIIEVRTVLLVALLAVTRKLIILDFKTASASTIIALGAALLCLGVVYRLMREPLPAAAPVVTPAGTSPER